METLTFALIIGLPFLLEGIGVNKIHHLIPYYYSIVPSLLWFSAILRKRTIRFPLKASFYFLIFLIASCVSAFFFSVEKQVSFEFVLYYCSFFFIFIYYYNHRVQERVMFVFFLSSGVFLSVLSFILKPQTEYQLVYSFISSHNHLGDIAGLILVACVYKLIQTGKRVYILPILFFIPILLFSFSRSAYISFLLLGGLMILFEKNRGQIKRRFIQGILLLLGIITIFFIFVTTKEIRNVSILSPVHQVLTKQFNLKWKDLLAKRPEYFNQALQSSFYKPWFGVGPGNFSYASKRFQQNYSDSTTDSHNIFLEILAENGLIALFGFTLFIIVVLKRGIANRTLFFYLFIYLLLNFQTDYTYRIYGILTLFIFLAGHLFTEEKQWGNETIFGLGSILLMIMFILILTSQILLKQGRFREAVIVNPFNTNAYSEGIRQEREKGNIKNVFELARRLEWVSQENTTTLLFLSDIYEKAGSKRKALDLLERAYKGNKFVNIKVVKQIYRLKIEIESQQKATIFFREALLNYQKIPPWFHDSNFQNELIELCTRAEGKRCNIL